MIIEPLSRAHFREGFDCGDAQLNAFLQHQSGQAHRKGLSKSFVLVREVSPGEIMGFYTLAIFEIQAVQLPQKFARKYRGCLPASKLARLAVSKNHQKQGLGRLLLADAIRQILLVSQSVGIVGFFVDAKDETVQRWYKRAGFLELPDNPLTLFLPPETLRASVEGFS